VQRSEPDATEAPTPPLPSSRLRRATEGTDALFMLSSGLLVVGDGMYGLGGSPLEMVALLPRGSWCHRDHAARDPDRSERRGVDPHRRRDGRSIASRSSMRMDEILR
jgi:hypothetical protein